MERIELPELTQEEFNKFVKIVQALSDDSWYSNRTLLGIAEEYNLEYKDEYE